MSRFVHDREAQLELAPMPQPTESPEPLEEDTPDDVKPTIPLDIPADLEALLVEQFASQPASVPNRLHLAFFRMVPGALGVHTCMQSRRAQGVVRSVQGFCIVYAAEASPQFLCRRRGCSRLLDAMP